MSLYVYDKYDIENGNIDKSNVVIETSIYFDENVLLINEDEVKNIIKTIDNADYLDEVFFNGYLGHRGVVSKKYLSAGCKVVLNVFTDRDTIFSIEACGYNALYYILTHNYGSIFITPKLISSSVKLDVACDIVYKGKAFNRLSNFYMWRWENGYSK